MNLSRLTPVAGTRLVVVGVLASALAWNGAATLYAAVTAPTIHACAGAKGAMRYVPSGKCSKGETALSWNITGPQGPAGPAASGSTSAPTLYSTGWIKTRPPQSGVISAPWTAASLDLPAGSYDVRVIAYVTGKDSFWTCRLFDAWTSFGFGQDAWTDTFTLQDVTVLTAPGRVQFTCNIANRPLWDSFSYVQAELVAQPVALIDQ